MPYDNRDEDGRHFVPEYTDDAFLTAVRELDRATTPGIAEDVGCVESTAYRRLKSLEDEEGVVESEKIGQTTFWRIVEE